MKEKLKRFVNHYRKRSVIILEIAEILCVIAEIVELFRGNENDSPIDYKKISIVKEKMQGFVNSYLRTFVVTLAIAKILCVIAEIVDLFRGNESN